MRTAAVEKSEKPECPWIMNGFTGSRLLWYMQSFPSAVSPGLKSACWQSECPSLLREGSFDSSSS